MSQLSILDTKPPEKPTPRPHQEDGFEDAVEFLFGNKKRERGLFVAPVAYGKSYALGFLAYECLKRDQPCIVLQPNQTLLKQNLQKFRLYGGVGTIFCAGIKGKSELSKYVFATPGSLIKVLGQFEKMDHDYMILLDEADFGAPVDDGFIAMLNKSVKLAKENFPYDSVKGNFMKIWRAVMPLKTLGFTASPVKLKSSRDGSYLSFLSRERPCFWQKIVHVCQIQEMKDWWTPLIYNQHQFDTSKLKVKKNGSEYTEDSISKAVQVNNVNNKMYLDMKMLLESEERKHVLVFVDRVANANKFEELFPGQAYTITGETPKDRRIMLEKRFKRGEFPFLINVQCFTMGFDYPELDGILWGYPTMSWRLFYQILGRLVRVIESDAGKPFEERIKPDGLVVDYCNNVGNFGPIEDITIENLENFGWGIFQGDQLITKYPLKERRRTKKELVFLNSPEVKKMRNPDSDQPYLYVHFGKKYRGKPLKNVDDEWLNFMVNKAPRNSWSTLMYRFLEAAEQEIQIRVLLQQQKQTIEQ